MAAVAAVEIFAFSRCRMMIAACRSLSHAIPSGPCSRTARRISSGVSRSHPNVQITDPAGYTFPVATDYACRNRLLHSRPVDGSEYLPRLWRAGLRGYQLVFNVAGDPVHEVVAGFRRALDALAVGTRPDTSAVRAALGGEFTRGHFARAV